jgi:hypothetical protein
VNTQNDKKDNLIVEIQKSPIRGEERGVVWGAEHALDA